MVAAATHLLRCNDNNRASPNCVQEARNQDDESRRMCVCVKEVGRGRKTFLPAPTLFALPRRKFSLAAAVRASELLSGIQNASKQP